MHLTFTALGVDIGNFSFPGAWAALRPWLRPERRHIIKLAPMVGPKL